MSQYDKPAVAVPAASLTEIAVIKNVDKKVLCFHFDVADQAIDDFDVLARANDGAQFQDFTPASWSSLPSGGRIRETSVSTTSTGAYVDGDLNTVATTQNGYFAMDIEGLTEIVIKASAASDNASVTPRWSLQ